MLKTLTGKNVFLDGCLVILAICLNCKGWITPATSNVPYEKSEELTLV